MGINDLKYGWLLVSLFASYFLLAQNGNKAQFLADDLPFRVQQECLDENFEYDALTLEIPQQDSQQIIGLKVTLNDGELLFVLETYDRFDGEQLYQSLKKHYAFERESTIYFDFFKQTNTNKENLYSLSFCLTSSEIIKAGNTRGNATSGDKKFARVPIFYATDRKDTRDPDVYERFGGELAGDFNLNYGLCEITIPVIHKVGQIESPTMWSFEFSEDPEKHIVLEKISSLNETLFFKKISERIALSPKRKTFMFIHGYNVSFADAAKRTAQIKYDLDFDGEAVLYSWPSQGATSAYTIDENNIRWATANIKNFLEDYITRSNAEEIYLIAHSMGNRGLTDALIDLANEKPQLMSKITEIILAAPDIDAAIFKRDIAPQMVSKIKKPITLYISADDVALEASKTLHGRPRAGDAEYGIMLVAGVETIDATGVDSSFLSHSYFAETKSILDDLINVLKSNLRANKRAALKKVTTPEGSYWKID